MLSPRRRLRTTDAGFTLIEVMIVVAILAVISVPLGNVIIGYLKNTDTTSERMMLSHDAQIATVYFGRDVAATGIRDYTTVDGTGDVSFKQSIQLGGQGCGSASKFTALVSFLSDDWSNASGSWAVTLDVVSYVPEGNELHRVRCAGGTTTDMIVAHNLLAGSASVGCSGGSNGCTGYTPPPSQVSLSFSVTQPHAGPYVITLSGQRRQT